MRPPVRKEMYFRGEVGEVVRGAHDVGADVDVERRDEDGDEREEGDHGGLVEAAEQRDGAPDGLAEDDGGGGGAGDADEAVEGHRDGKPEGLADDLRRPAIWRSG